MARNVPIRLGESDARDFAIEKELGVNNVLTTGSWYDWGIEPLPQGTVRVARDPLAPTTDKLVAMIRGDGLARALWRLLILPIRAAFAQSKWIEPQGGGAAETEFANNMWTLPPQNGGMEVPASMFLRQTLLSLAYGTSPFEIVRTVPQTGPLKGQLVIKKMAYRDPSTVTFLVDRHGTFQGFKQYTNWAGETIDETIKPEDSWYYASDEEENPILGISMFEPAYKHYQMKWKFYYIGNLAAQFAAVPGRIGHVPLGASATAIRNFSRDISNFAFNTSMLAPPGFEVKDFNGNSNFDFTKLIDHHNMMMATSVLAKFIQQDDRPLLIDNSVDASADLFLKMLEAITNEIAESWTTKLMPQFIDANFGSGNYPVFKFAPLADQTKDMAMAIFQTIASATTLNTTPEFVRQNEMHLSSRLGYDIDYKEIEKQEEEAAKQQAEVQKQMAEQGAAVNPDGTPAGAGGNQMPGGYQNQYSANQTKPPTQGSKVKTVPGNNSTVAASADLDDADRAILALSALAAHMDEFEPVDDVDPLDEE